MPFPAAAIRPDPAPQSASNLPKNDARHTHFPAEADARFRTTFNEKNGACTKRSRWEVWCGECDVRIARFPHSTSLTPARVRPICVLSNTAMRTIHYLVRLTRRIGSHNVRTYFLKVKKLSRKSRNGHEFSRMGSKCPSPQMNTDGHRWEKTSAALRWFDLNRIEFELPVSIRVHLWRPPTTRSDGERSPAVGDVARGCYNMSRSLA